MSDESSEPKGQNVPLESIFGVARQAAADADVCDEVAAAWGDLIETAALKMTQETFAGRVGQRFEIDLGQHDVQVELKEVTCLGEALDLGEGAPCRPPFSLLFRGHSPRALLPEGIYRICHEELGTFELHLRSAQRESVKSQNPNLPHLEAVFN